MISAVICGNLGKDSEVRQAGNTTVCSFSVASTTKVKGEDATTWVRCSLFGQRGEKLSEYLTKGKPVCVSGGLTTREYEGKTYLEMRVDDVKLMGSKESGGESRGSSSRSESKPRGGKSEASSKPASGTANYPDADYGGDDDIPFINNVSCETKERWWKS